MSAAQQLPVGEQKFHLVGVALEPYVSAPFFEPPLLEKISIDKGIADGYKVFIIHAGGYAFNRVLTRRYDNQILENVIIGPKLVQSSIDDEKNGLGLRCQANFFAPRIEQTGMLLVTNYISRLPRLRRYVEANR